MDKSHGNVTIDKIKVNPAPGQKLKVKIKIKAKSYNEKQVNRAREMVGEGKASKATKPYSRGGNY